MKKKSIFFSILGACLGIGIVLIIIGAALGARLRNLSIDSKYENKKGVSTKLPNLSLTDTTDIQNLDFDLSASNIEIRCGDTFSVQGNYLSVNEVHDGTWTLESSLTDHFYQINLFGLVRIPFPYRHHRNNDSYGSITITIPEGVSLDEMDLELSASDVTIEKLDSKEIDLDVAAGAVTIASIAAKEADISVSAGDITINEYHITKSASLDCSLGNIDFGSRKYAENNLCNNLTVSCSMGDIDVYGKLTGDNELDCSMGDITLKLVGSHANYDILSSSTSLGDISYSTKNFTKKSEDSTGLYTSKDNSTFGTLSLDCSMGNIDVWYLYATELPWNSQ